MAEKVEKEFIGVNITGEAKAALIEEAARRGISLSTLTREKIKDMLVSLGYSLDEE